MDWYYVFNATVSMFIIVWTGPECHFKCACQEYYKFVSRLTKKSSDFYFRVSIFQHVGVHVL